MAVTVDGAPQTAVPDPEQEVEGPEVLDVTELFEVFYQREFRSVAVKTTCFGKESESSPKDRRKSWLFVM